MESSLSSSPMTRTSHSKKLIGYGIALIMLLFLAKTFFTNWHEIQTYSFRVNEYWLIVSWLISCLSVFLVGFTWNYILRILEPASLVGWFDAIKINAISGLGKYVPGKLFGLAAIWHWGSERQLSKKGLSVSYLLQTLMNTVASLVFGVTVVSFTMGEISAVYYYSAIGLLFIGLFFILNHKRFLQLMGFLTRVFIKRGVDLNELRPLSLKQLSLAFLFSFVNVVLTGCLFFYLVRSLVEVDATLVVPLAGLFIFSQIMGYVTLIIPGGLGVQEGILTLLLSRYFPFGVSALLAVCIRLWVVVCDVTGLLLLFGIGKYISRKNKRYD